MMDTAHILSYLAGIALGLALPEAAARLCRSFRLLPHRLAGFMRGAGDGGRRRVLCLGDSLTGGRFARHLEEILNRDGGGAFTVAEEGAYLDPAEGRTPLLAARLEAALAAHAPDIVVVMTGIHDKGYIVPYPRAPVRERLAFFDLVPPAAAAVRRAARAALRPFRARAAGDRECARRLVREGRALVEQGKPEEAEKLFRQAAEADPSSGEAFFWTGWACQELVRLEEAEEAFRTAIASEPSGSAGCSGLGWFYQDYLGWVYRDYAVVRKMKELFARALDNDPRDSSAYAGLGWIAKLEGRPEEAERLLLKAVEANPADGRALVELGLLYRRLPERGKAEETLRKAAATGVRDSRAYSALGWIHLERKETGEAAELFRRAVQADKRDREAYAGLAWASGPRGAVEFCAQALREDQPYEVRDLLCRLRAIHHLACGNAREAEACFRRAEAQALENFNPVTRDGCRRIAEELSLRKVRAVFMQYPVRSVEPMRKMLRGREAVFVDNERAFKEALAGGEPEEYFTDLFGGDFGRCTDKAARLMAENCGRAILDECMPNRIN